MNQLIALLIAMVDAVLQNLLLVIQKEKAQDDAIRQLSRKVNQLEEEVRQLKGKP
jgi:cell division protein FtsB